MLISCKEHPQADALVFNAKIYTVDSAFHIVEAMALKDGLVLDTGSSDYIRRLYRSEVNYDLEGKTIFPAFNDAHAHFVGYAESLNTVNLFGTKSFDEVIERVNDFAMRNEVPFLFGRGWDQNDWENKNFPIKARLDELFPNTPVMLARVDGHAALVNQAALDYAGVQASTKVKGGRLIKEKGRLTGVLVDNAMTLVQFPEMSREKRLGLLIQAQDSLLKYGVTSLTDAGLGIADIHLLDSMATNGMLKIRVNAMVEDDPVAIAHFLNHGKIEKEHLRVQCVKTYVDGALGSRGAVLLKPYTDDKGNYGMLLSDPAHFEELAVKLDSAGWQLAAHTIGDSANRMMINMYRKVLKGKTNHRWRLEHAQMVHPADQYLMSNAHIIPSVQPTHATSDMYWASDRVGEDRIRYSYAYQSLLRYSGVLPLGTDFPVESINPFYTFRAAKYRQDEAGFPAGGFISAERLTTEQTLRGMTHWAAYAEFTDNIKGQLVPGKLADFIVLDKDITKVPVNEISSARVLYTIINGTLEYEYLKPE